MGSFFLHTLEQGFLFFPLVLGLFLSFQVLKTTDMTADGSFVLGAALFAKFLLWGYSPGCSLMIAILGSGLCGVANSFLQAHGKIHPLIAGIFLLFILHSLTLILMGRSNISLLAFQNIFSKLSQTFFPTASRFLQVVSLVILGLILLIGMYYFVKSPLGLLLRAYGDHPELLRKIGRHPNRYRALGLFVSSSLAGLSGALSAQLFGYADISMGAGQAMIGIAILLFGLQWTHFFAVRKANLQILGVLFATLLYFVSISFLVWIGINPLYLRAMIGVGLCLLFLGIHNRFPNQQIRF